MQIFTCDQGSPEWFAARMGIPTASEFSTVQAKGRSGGDSKTRRTYMLKLAGEILTGAPMDHFGNGHTERGHEMEPDARRLYALAADCEPELIGFARDGRKGCSPDALVGSDGLLEIKTKLPHLLIDLILSDKFPSEHYAQCQGALWVTGRSWIDLAVYCPGIPLYTKRLERDEPYISALASAVDEFNAELDDVVSSIVRFGGSRALEFGES